MLSVASRLTLRNIHQTRSYLTPARQFHSSNSIMSEVKKTIIKQGDGKNFPKKGDTVTMHYVGTLTNGNKFDSSVDRGTPFKTAIGVGRVIQGWDIAVPTMSLNEKASIHIPYHLAYGERGFPPVIPAKADLIFEVELLKIN